MPDARQPGRRAPQGRRARAARACGEGGACAAPTPPADPRPEEGRTGGCDARPALPGHHRGNRPCLSMARMTRRVPPALRTWSGALLVCALMLCLSGLARPAVAMPMSMPASMGTMSAPAGAESTVPGQTSLGVAGQAVRAAEASYAGPHCPMAQQQCVSPKATIAQDSPTAPKLGGVPPSTACPRAVLVPQSNAPPALPPPDLHRLCVSRT